MIKLFIDDERFPVTDDWIIVRSSYDAIYHVMAFGFPDVISFDHDLGDEDTSIPFINWLTEQVLDGKLIVPKHFEWYVHSQNPIGAQNIVNKCLDLEKIRDM